MNKRDFIKIAAANAFGLYLIPQSNATSDVFMPAKHVIYLFMDGGMSHLDTFDPKENSEVNGGVKLIDTNLDGVRISSRFENLAKRMDKICLIRSMTSQMGAHEQGQYLSRTSFGRRGTIVHPHLGAWMSHIFSSKKTLPRNVVISPSNRHPRSGFLDKVHSPISVVDPNKGLENSKIKITPDQFDKRLELLGTIDKNFPSGGATKAHEQFYEEALKLVQSKEVSSFDISKESNDLRDKYGRNKFGQGCLLARRLVENGTKFVEISHGGWDTHQNNNQQMDTKVPAVDQGLSALISDLNSRGMLEDTLIVLTTEFGRTPKINSNYGRDHHITAFSSVLVGGPIKQGFLYGASDEKGLLVESNPVKVQDFNATIAKAAGVDIEKEYLSPEGRPFKVANKGVPILDVFA